MHTAPSTHLAPGTWNAAPDPRVSVIVAAKNAETTLTECLASLKALDYPSFDITVVDDGSTDATGEIARAAGVTVLNGRGLGAGAARNDGARQSSGEIVAFTDADCTVPHDWLRALVSTLARPGVAGAGGQQRNIFPPERAEGAAGLDAFFRTASIVSAYTRADGQPIEVDHVASCNSAYWRGPFFSVGGFPEDIWPGEDVVLDLRLREAGHRAFYTPAAIVYHHRPGTSDWFRSMMRRYGQAEHELMRRLGRFRPIHHVPRATVTALALQVFLLVGPIRPWLLAIDLGAIIFAGTLLVRSAPIRQWPAVLWYSSVGLSEYLLGWYGRRYAGIGAERLAEKS